ncbi:GNAT family N-acetyltransferase [Tropicimonas sp. IMCC34043]|uniref:GNAT family N-acetyltransferase n=1 Tax=Tropicimonas sp. IMCC34043 TaxID=2248760 RepID=UPI000E24B018|nr:N-acetyltransferase [Tropicimonas sp. IMCC34043]
MELSNEGSEDWWEVEALYDLCFAPGRSSLSSYRLREGVPPISGLCLLARDHGILAGAIRTWPVRVAGLPAALIGPVAVHPTHQGEGIGGFLIRTVVDRAEAHGRVRLMLVGDAPYYGRFGFKRLEGVEMPPPTNPDRVLGVGDWDGIRGPVERALPGWRAAGSG